MRTMLSAVLFCVANVVAMAVANAAPQTGVLGADGGASGPSLSEVASNDEKRRSELKRQILDKWAAHVQETYLVSGPTWAKDMEAVLAASSTASLEAAATAKNFMTMDEALVPSRRSVGLNAAKKLGDTTTDLVFVPITPCRIADTRLAGGQIAANSVRSFDVTAVADYSFQGGDASNCSGAGSAGSFAAAAFNFTVVTPTAAGYITAFPFLATQPLAATVNYTAGDIRGNFAIVKLDQGASASELSVYSFAQTHLVIDMVGYFINPEATAPTCTEVTSAGIDILAGNFGSQTTAACPTGSQIMSGGCSSSSFDGKVVTSRTFLSSQNHFCAFRNQGTGTINFVAYGVCCKVPGR
jgi:hypothetical protein